MLAASFVNKLYFHFHLVKNVFSLETSSLTAVVFRDVLCELQLFGSFSVIPLLVTSGFTSVIPLRSESRDYTEADCGLFSYTFHRS